MLDRVIVAIAAVMGAVSAASAQEVRLPGIDFGRYHALVIGNNNYDRLPKLKTAVVDAVAVAELLRIRYEFDVTLLLDADRKRILEALNGYRRDLTKRDNLLIYYAGHGVLDEETETGFWLPVDAEANSDTYWIPNADLSRRLRAMSARHVLVVADSCFSGTLLREVAAMLPTGRARLAWLERMNGLVSRTALVSGGLEPVVDSGGGDHSVFARAFLDALRRNDEVLDAQALFRMIGRPVLLNADQTPRYSDIKSAGHQGGEFLFVPSAAKVAAAVDASAPAASPTRAQAASFELAFWNSIRDSADPADFRAYLEAYPDGTFVLLARNRMKAAKAKQTALIGPPKPAIEIEPIEAEYVVVRNANLRERPNVRAPKVATLRAGASVHVAGRVKGRNWYLVERDDESQGFVFGELLKRPEAASVAMAPSPKPPAPSAARPAVGVFPAAPGESFRDCAECPEMTVIPAGRFIMGSPAGEPGRYDNEGPAHAVTVPRPFALGKFEVTFEDWDACVRAGGCRHAPDDQGRGRGRRPAIDVSWSDARAYARWLNRRTGQAYRLPTEAEWEYAARAGSTTSRFWGEEEHLACDFANVHDAAGKRENRFVWRSHGCRDGYGKTAPVGSFRANDFGLYDMLGNAWEWTEDCWNDGYAGARSDGAARTTGTCTGRVLRGGSWATEPRGVRSAVRITLGTDHRGAIVGFRVARTLQ